MKNCIVSLPAALLLPVLLLVASCGEKKQASGFAPQADETTEALAANDAPNSSPRSVRGDSSKKSESLREWAPPKLLTGRPQTVRRLAEPIPAAAVSFETFGLDAAKGGEYTAASGAVLRIPPDAFEDANGNLVSGKVDFKFREFRDAAEILSSGLPMACDSAGAAYLMQSGGMFEARAGQKSRELRLRAGKSVAIDYPPTRRGDGFNFYALDETSGQWNYERAFGQEMAPQVAQIDTVYYPLGLLAPSDGNCLKLTFKPSVCETNKRKRVIDVHARAYAGHKSKWKSVVFEGSGQYLADKLKTGNIDTLKHLNWQEYLAAFQCRESAVNNTYREASWRKRGWINMPDDVYIYNYDASNVFADCFQYAVNELKMTRGKVTRKTYMRFGCQIECGEPPYFLFLRAYDGKPSGENLSDAIVGVDNLLAWREKRTSEDFNRVLNTKDLTEYETRAREICDQLSQDTDSGTCAPMTKSQAIKTANAAFRGHAELARLRGNIFPAETQFGGVSVNVSRLGVYNIDRFMKSRPFPKKVPVVCAADFPESTDSAAAPRFATLFCYRRKEEVMQTYPAALLSSSSREMHGVLHTIPQGWDMVGLALQDGRVALLDPKELRKLSFGAVQRSSDKPVRLQFRFSEDRVMNVEDLRALLKGGA